MKRFSTTIAVLALLGAPLFTACGDDGTNKPGNGVDTIFPDAIGGDTTADGAVNPLLVRALDFEQAFGDDQRFCRSQDRCSIFISYTERRLLKVKYTEDSVAKAGQVVKFTIENDAANLGFINSVSAVTDADGIASIETKARVGEIGQFTVKVTVDKTELPPKFFDVVVSPKGQVPLTVVGSYNGTRAVGNYQVLLYKQTANVPGCNDILDLMEHNTAEYTSSPNILLNQSTKFPVFRNLETEVKQMYTIVLVSRNTAPVPAVIAWGCDAVQGEVQWGLSKTVQVELVDRPPIYVGSYTLTSNFDFVSMIPQPYRDYVDAVLEIFANPISGILDLVCVVIGDADNELCKFKDGPIAGVITPIISDLIIAFLPERFRDIFLSGEDVAKILTSFEVNERLTIRTEPNEFGIFDSMAIHHEWFGIKYRWRLGQDCPPDSTTCGVNQLNMTALGSGTQNAIEGTASGKVENTWDLHINEHSVSLKYGALISAIVQNIIFPLVTNGAADSYEDIIRMLFGGRGCLINNTVTCCDVFASRVSNFQDVARTGCNAAVSLVPGLINGLLGPLTLDSDSAFTLATDGACSLEDSDADMVVDEIGSANSPCKWKATVRFGANAQTGIEATFYGNRN